MEKKTDEDLKSFRYNTMRIIEIFSKTQPVPDLGVKPSVYTSELLMSAHERQNYLCQNNDCVKLFPNTMSRHLLDKWDVKPRVIFFCNWLPHNEYQVVFTIRNKYRSSKLLKVRLDCSDVFELEELTHTRRLASIVTAGYKVTFRPKQAIDYNHYVTMSAETETLRIPILALGPRPIINFPDRIDFGESLVNYSNEKVIQLKNIGQISATAIFQTVGPISLEQEKITLEPEECKFLKVTLVSNIIGFMNALITATYETGERVYINVMANSVCGEIYLERRNVQLDRTYIGLKTTQTLVLHNKTEHMLTFRWLRNKDIGVDQEDWRQLCHGLDDLMDINRRKVSSLKYLDIANDQEHEAAIATVIKDETSHFINEFYFIDSCIRIHPLFGEVWPMSDMHFQITFSPVEAITYKTVTYLDIAGLDQRLKVTLSGEAIGPNICLNATTLDFGHIFSCTNNTYNVMVRNLGLIKGRIRHTADRLLCGGEITCTPEECELLPEETVFMVMNVRSNILGPFLEDVYFIILESDQKIKLTIKGEIVNPELTVDKLLINFGEVGLGTETTQTFRIKNDSRISAEIRMMIDNDGIESAIRLSDGITEIPEDPKEFTLTPEECVIESGHCLTVQITLVPNIVRKHSTQLLIYFRDVVVSESSIDISYESMTARLVAATPEINMDYAFINYEYMQEVEICNMSTIPSYFAVLPQEEDEDTGLIYRLEEEESYIEEESTKIFKIYIKITTLTQCIERLKMRVFGVLYSINFCTITGFGIGPVVRPSLHVLSWGKIKILEEIEKTVLLVNDSPITALYKLTVRRQPEVFILKNTEGSIPPDECVEVAVIAKARDHGLVTDEILVEVHQSSDIFIKISAVGYGLSIVTQPNIFPLYDIGSVFRNEMNKETIEITNVSTKQHMLLFTTTKGSIGRRIRGASEIGNCFKLEPNRVDLPGGATAQISLTYLWKKQEVMEETYYCYATIDNQGKKLLLGSSTMKAAFTNPEFLTEPKHMYFRVDIELPSNEVEPLYQSLKVTSFWCDVIEVECTLKPPFSFSTGASEAQPNLHLNLEPDSEKTLIIRFDPPDVNLRRIKIIHDVLTIACTGHTIKHIVNLTGEVNFPNVSLSTRSIDFDCVEPGGEATYQILIKNVSPLKVQFDWRWDKISIDLFKEVPKSGRKDSSTIVSVPLHDCIDTDKYLKGTEGKKTEDANRHCLQDLRSSVITCKQIKKTLEALQLTTDNNKLPRDLPSLIKQLTIHTYYYDKIQYSTKAPNVESKINIFRNVFSEYIPTIDKNEGNLFSSNSTKITSTVYKSESEDSEPLSEISKDLKNVLDLNSSTDEQTTTTCIIDSSIDENTEDLILMSSTERSNEICKTRIAEDELLSEMSEIIDINPCHTSLDPKESALVTFLFSPSKPLTIECKAICQIYAGPNETIDIQGCSHPLQYYVIPQIVNFGFGLFCEVWCSNLFVFNRSPKEINVLIKIPKVIYNEKDEKSKRSLPYFIGVQPKSTKIKPFQLFHFIISVYPGRVGEIEQLLYVQVDNEEPFHLKVEGYATPSQVHIGVPHTPSIRNDLVMYDAIARITSSWLTLNLKDLIKVEIEEEELSAIQEEIEKKYDWDFENGWDLLMQKTDLVPSVDDINMAYELYLCEEYAEKFSYPIPQHNPTTVSCECLPGFTLPPYVADFGLIIAGTKALCVIPYRNYTPINTTIKVIPPRETSILDKFGVIFKLQPTYKLKGYEKKKFEIFIRPTREVFENERSESIMEFTFYFMVTCGGTIPVTVKALVTQPKLIAPKVIDFEGVKIGYKRIIKFKLKNVSKVDSEWFAILRPVQNTEYLLHNHTIKYQTKNNTFSASPVYGYLNPGKVTVISVTFEPINEVPNEVDLIFVTNMNSTYRITRLRGYGNEQRLLYRDVSFGYSVPFSKPLVKQLTVYNPSLFPIEVFLQGMDKMRTFEQKLFKVILSYYDSEKLSIPSRFFTTKMSNEVWDMFSRLAMLAIQKYIEDAKTFLCLSLRHYILGSKVKFICSPSDSTIASRKTVSRAKRKTLTSLKEKKTEINILSNLITEIVPIKSLEEIIKDYSSFVNSYNIPHINLAVEEKKLSQITNESMVGHNSIANLFKDGNAVIVHSCPKSHPGLFCWLLKKHTGLIYCSLDREILKEIVEGKTEEGLHLRNIIYNYYLTAKDSSSKKLSGETKTLPKGFKELIHVIIKDKQETAYKKKYSSKVKMVPDPIQKKTDNFNPTFLNFPKYLLQAILQRRLCKKMEPGIIISLSSKFIPAPLVALDIILNILKEYKNVNIVSLYGNVDMCLRLDKNLVNLKLIETFRNFTGLDILEASPSFIKQAGRDYYEQRRLLAKMELQKNKDKKVKGSPKATAAKSTNALQSQSSNVKKLLIPKVVETENVFFIYENELMQIKRIVENFIRASLSPKEVFSSLSLNASKRNEFMKLMPSITNVKPDFRVEENIGFPLWILNDYPFNKEGYQFSVFLKFLSSVATGSTSEKTVVPTTKKLKRTMEKSYYVINRSNVDCSNDDNVLKDDNGHGLFELSLSKKGLIMSSVKLQSGIFEKVSQEYKSVSDAAYIESSINGGRLSGEQEIDSTVTAKVKILEERLMEELKKFDQRGEADGLSRKLLKPCEHTSWDVTFHPKGCCDYEYSVPLAIGGCSSTTSAKITAGCDIPDISFKPSDVFYKIVYDDVEDEYGKTTEPSFLTKNDIFHFGHVLAYNSLKERVFHAEGNLRLINTSNVDVKLKVALITDQFDYEFDSNDGSSRNRRTKKRRTFSKYKIERRKSHGKGQNLKNKPSSPQDSIGRRGSSGKKSKTMMYPLSKQRTSNPVPERKVKAPNVTLDTSAFSSRQSQLQIKAGEENILTIYAHPSARDSIQKDGRRPSPNPSVKSQPNRSLKLYDENNYTSCEFLFSIENNPKVYCLKVLCNSIFAYIDFQPKELNFEEVVLYRSTTKCFSISNPSRVSLNWKIRDPESLLTQVSISKVEGSLNPGEHDAIFVTYQAKNIESVSTELIVGVFHSSNENYELQKHHYHINLKSYSVDVTFYFDLSGSDHLFIEEVEVNFEIQTFIKIENCGSNTIHLRIELNDKQLELNQDSLIVIIENKTGSVRAGEKFKSKIVVVITNEIILQNFPFLFIKVVDDGSKEDVAIIPAFISVHSQYPKYGLYPSQTFDFGNMEVGTVNCLNFTFENTGFVDVHFQCTLSEIFRLASMGKSLETPYEIKSKMIENEAFKNNSLALSSYIRNLLCFKKTLLRQKAKWLAEKTMPKPLTKAGNISSSQFNYLLKKVRSKKTFNLVIQKRYERVQSMMKSIKRNQNVRKRNSKSTSERISTKKRSIKSRRSNRSISSRKMLDGSIVTSGSMVVASPFLLKPSEGVLKRGEQVVINVYCYPTEPGCFKKDIYLKIKNDSPDNGPINLKLTVQAIAPKLNFTDFENIFQEFEIFEKWKPRNYVYNKGLPYGMACTKEQTIHFCNVIIGSSVTYNIYLQTANHLAATVFITISGDSCFSLDGDDIKTCIVPPYDLLPLPVTFSPQILDVHEAVMKINVKASNNTIIERRVFFLRGSGNIPVIDILKLDSSEERNIEICSGYSIDLGLVQVNTQERKSFAIKNVGLVLAEVLFEIEEKSLFLDVFCGNIILRKSNAEERFHHSSVFQIHPGEKKTLDFLFKPMEVGEYQTVAYLHLKPFDMFTFNITGMAQQRTVTMKGLSYVDHQESAETVTENILKYDLDFGNNSTDVEYIKEFSIHNNCDEIIRFQFISPKCFSFIPSMGHLSPHSVKEIKAILFSSKPVSILEKVVCCFEKISVNKKLDLIDWDDSMISSDWLDSGYPNNSSHLDKSSFKLPEPEYSPIPDTEEIIQIFTMAVIDKPILTVSLQALNFPPVLVGQSEGKDFYITNESDMETEFSLSFIEKDPYLNGIPDVIDFTFGKFDYNLFDLPPFNQESLNIKVDSHWPHKLGDFSDEIMNSSRDIFHNLSKADENDWEILKMQHLSVIYMMDISQLEFIKDNLSEVSSILKLNSLESPSLTKHHSKLGKTDRKSVPKQKADITSLLEEDPMLKDSKWLPESSASIFTCEAHTRVIKPHETITCKIKFTPRHIRQYTSYMRVGYCNNTSEVQLKMTGVGFLPLCHIDIDDIDCLGREEHLIPKVPSKSRAVVIRSTDTDSRIHKFFNVYNISEISYHFKWYCVKNSHGEQKFKCHSIEGVIKPRESHQMNFSFQPIEYGTYESLWILCIKEFCLQQPLLLIGISKEPDITVEPAVLILNQTPKGLKSCSEVKLINYDNIDVHFSIDNNSLFERSNKKEVLSVTPTSGRLASSSSQVFQIQCTPQIMDKLKFILHIKINFSKKIVPLTVIASSYSNLPVVCCAKENYETVNLEPTNKRRCNLVSVGKVNMKIPYNLSFTIDNVGSNIIYFECYSLEDTKDISILIDHKNGVIQPKSSFGFTLKITALNKVCFKQNIIIKISKGPDFQVCLSGNAVTPLYKFSFDRYDFGRCVIQKSDPSLHHTLLQVYNLESDPLLVELKRNTKDSCAFNVNFKSLLIEPRCNHNILISFNPSEAEEYSTVLEFLINSSFEETVALSGKGEYFSLEVEKLEEYLIDFGSVMVGDIISRNVSVVNRSQVNMSFTLFAQERNKHKSNVELYVNYSGDKIALAPRGVCSVEVTFNAVERCKCFTSAIMYSAYGEKGVLFMTKAVVIDYEFSLDQSNILFGPTTIGCSNIQKVGLINSGDIGSRFTFKKTLVSDVFLIKPLEGYSSPGSTTVVQISFIPNTDDKYFNNMLICLIENYQPLSLSLSGIGVKLPLPMGIIKLKAQVRQQTSTLIKICNKSFAEQIIEPVITGEYFHGEKSVKIKAQETVMYEIHYSPLTQTKNQYHIGSLFYSIPSTGKSQLYKLLGTAYPPKEACHFNWYCQANKKTSVRIPVYNWSSASETFSVKVSCIETLPSIYYQIETLDTISIPSKDIRNCHFKFAFFKEEEIHLKIIFKNINSGEYVKYKVTVHVGEGDLPPLKKIAAYTREKGFSSIKLHNILKRKTSYHFYSPSTFIKPMKKIVNIKPMKKGHLKVEYLPPFPEHRDIVYLNLFNIFFGCFSQKLILQAYESPPQKQVIVEAVLGVSETFYLPLKNLSSEMALCISMGSTNDLHVAAQQFIIPFGKEYKLKVLFCPSTLGAQIMNLIIKSNKLGTICYNIKGIGLPPKPQGPFVIPINGVFKLRFKNVLNGNSTFACIINSEDFVINTNSFSLKPGEVQIIEAECKISSERILSNIWKLCVNSTNLPGIQWVYYLKVSNEEDKT